MTTKEGEIEKISFKVMADKYHEIIDDIMTFAYDNKQNGMTAEENKKQLVSRYGSLFEKHIDKEIESLYNEKEAWIPWGECVQNDRIDRSNYYNQFKDVVDDTEWGVI